LFITTALALKLQQMCHGGFSYNVCIQDLWERAQSEQVPRAKWSQFIEETCQQQKPVVSSAAVSSKAPTASSRPSNKKASQSVAAPKARSKANSKVINATD